MRHVLRFEEAPGPIQPGIYSPFPVDPTGPRRGRSVSLMTTVPLLNLIAMPVGVIAATLYWVRYLRQEN